MSSTMWLCMLQLAVLVLCTQASTQLKNVHFELSHIQDVNENITMPIGVSLRRLMGAKNLGIPPDDGVSNYGDVLHMQRVPGDKLLTREIQINAVSSIEQSLQWTGNFPGYTITHIRFLNVGRQRAYTQYVRTLPNGSSAEATVGVAAYMQFRLLIEVYGK